MRKKYLFFALIPIVLIAVFVVFFLDNWVENTLEENGEEIVGARVEIDNLKVTFFPIGVKWSAMRVANPNATWENLFETKEVKFAMDANQLLRSKFIIETIEVHNLIFGTKRSTDGALPEGKKKQSVFASAGRNFSRLAEDALKKTLGSNPVFDVGKLKHGFNPDSLIAAFDIKTIKNIDSLKKKVEFASSAWSNAKTDFEKTRLKVLEVEANIKAINVNELNNPQNILSAISTVDNAMKTVNDVTSVINKNGAAITNLVNSTVSSIDSIDNYIKSDFERLKSAARIPVISTPGVASLLVGSEMYERIKKYLYWADIARTNIKKYTPEPEVEKPSRFEGQDIKFPVERGYPKLWIKNVLLTYGSDEKTAVNSIRAKGAAKNITDNQMLTGAPMTVSLEGAGDDLRKLSLTGLFDRRKDVPLDEYTAKLAGVPVGEFKLGKSDFLPSSITNGTLNTMIKISIPGDNFDSKITFDLSGFAVQFQSEPKNIAESIVRDVLKGINSFNVELRLWNTGGGFDAALATDLDEKISKRLMEVIGAEFQKLQDELKTKFYSFIQQERNKFEKQYASKIDDIKKQISDYQSLFTDKTNFLEGKKKELNDKLNKEKNSFIENKLKDIFKK